MQRKLRTGNAQLAATLRCSSRRRAGFTLFEVVVSLALMMALFGSMFSFYYNMLESRRRLTEHTARHRAADLLIDRIEDALTTSVAGDAGRSIAGIDGSSHQLVVHSRGVAAHLAEAGGSERDVFSDLQQRSFEFEPGRQRVSLSTATGSREDLDVKIGMVRFRYHDGSDWQDSFNSLESQSLPAAVEVAVWFISPVDIETDNADAAEQMNSADGEFDLNEFAFDEGVVDDPLGEVEDQELPLPDRLRIINIPGGSAPSSEAGDEVVSVTAGEGAA